MKSHFYHVFVLLLYLSMASCKQETDTSKFAAWPYEPSAGDADKIIEKLDDWADDKPNEPLIYYHRAKQYEVKGEHALALRDISKAITLSPEKANYYLIQANLYTVLGDLKAAYSSAQLAEQKGETNAAVYMILGRSAYQQQQYIKAIEWFGRAETQLNSTEFFNLYGDAYLQTNDTARASLFLQKALEGKPCQPDAYASLIQLRLRQKELKSAVNIDAHRAQNCSSSSQKLEFQRAELVLALNKPDSAAALFEAVYSTDNNQWKAAVRLGIIARGKKNYTTAIEWYKKAELAKPTSATLEMGLVYEVNLQNLYKAREILALGVQSDSTNTAFKTALSRVEWKLKRPATTKSKEE